VVFTDGTRGTIGVEKLDKISEMKMSKLYIDIGASSEDEAREKVNIGDSAVYAPNFNDNGDRITSSYFDDRIGCYTLIDTIKKLSETSHEVYFVFTAQEEVGARGAKTAAFQIEPDIGIAVDVTGTGDTPEAHTMDVSLGNGTAIKVKDKGSITHPWVKKMLTSTAEEHSINYQLEVLEYGGTDAMTIHTTKGGIPSGTVSIPCRYIHTPGETVDLNDVKASVDLLTKLLENNID
jgi:endoglucanase